MWCPCGTDQNLGILSFSDPVLRSGMPSRSVKDCRVGRKNCALLAMTQIGAPAGRIRIWEFYRFPIPCFVPGCHTFGLKIATAALRPRNDTKMEHFMLGKHTFLFYEVIFARCCSASFFKRFVPKNVPFLSKTCQICHCEEGACARRGNLKRSETASRNEARRGCAVKFGRWPSEIR